MKKILPVILAAAILSPAVSAEYVPASDWAAEKVRVAEELGIAVGGAELDYPGAVTRELFCEFIYGYYTGVAKRAEIPAEENKFADTENSHIVLLNSLGIIEGKSDTEFCPDDLLTREEAAAVVLRLLNALYPERNSHELYFEFTDGEQISDWAADGIQAVCNADIMQGVGDGKFAPKDNFTTEQAAAVLVRVYESFEDDEAKDVSVGIIGGADGPTQIIVGETVAPEKITVTDTIELDDFYIDEAVKLTAEVAELAADEKIMNLYAVNTDITSKMASSASGEPSAVYYISANRQKIEENIKAMYEDEASDGEMIFMMNRIDFSAIASMINASCGAENLAATAVLTNSRGYVMPEDFTNDFALYSEYDGEYSVLVTFSKFGDGVIKANVTFVNNGERDNIFSRLYEIEQGLGKDCIFAARVTG